MGVKEISKIEESLELKFPVLAKGFDTNARLKILESQLAWLFLISLKEFQDEYEFRARLNVQGKQIPIEIKILNSITSKSEKHLHIWVDEEKEKETYPSREIVLHSDSLKSLSILKSMQNCSEFDKERYKRFLKYFKKVQTWWGKIKEAFSQVVRMIEQDNFYLTISYGSDLIPWFEIEFKQKFGTIRPVLSARPFPTIIPCSDEDKVFGKYISTYINYIQSSDLQKYLKEKETEKIALKKEFEEITGELEEIIKPFRVYKHLSET